MLNKDNYDRIEKKILNSCKTKETTCFEIYSSVDKIKLSTTKWLCVKSKYKNNKTIETYNFEENSIFEKKCLNVGLKYPLRLPNRKNKQPLIKLIYFYLNYIIFVQKIYITT